MAAQARRAMVAAGIAVAAIAAGCLVGWLPAGPAVEEAGAGRLDGPAVSVTSPRAGVTVSGTTTLEARASSAGQVTWYVDGVAVAEASAPWKRPWDSTRAANGRHHIYAVAVDRAGTRRESAEVAFVVSNTTPAPSPTGSPTRSASPTVSAAPSPTPQPSTSDHGSMSDRPPPRGGYFSARPVGSWSSLPGDAACAAQVRRSTWEPRPDNGKRNHVMPDPAAVHRSLSARPVAVGGSYDSRWDSWLLQRVDGQFTGTTDEIFQWAACKWGLSDDVLRAIAVRESTWYQYETYPSGRPVNDWGSGDVMQAGISGARLYCDGIAQYGYDYQRDLGSGRCPRTFSIVGVMSWQDPSWGSMPGNQNGTFPFNRDSTAFAVDYLGSQLRGCYEGWESWLSATGSKTYRAGDMWGCVGAWYAGEWRSSAANGYISRVQSELANVTWLTPEWPSIKPGCDPTHGCPGPAPY